MKKLTKVLVGVMLVLFAVLAFGFKADTAYAKDSSGDYVIILDPGHGGNDSGAVSLHGDKEAVLNWNIAMGLKAELQTYSGVKVYLTRGSAEYQSNIARGRAGEDFNADYVISIHNNSSSSSSAKGVIVYGSLNSKYNAKAKALSKSIVSELNSVGITTNSGGFGTRESGNLPGRDYYTVIDEATLSGAVGIIIEHCFLSNSSDSAFVHDINNQYKMGAADATGIAKALGLTKRGVASGNSINLTRTYSAYMISSKEGTYSSSNESVAKVRKDGLITAVGAGNAVITCTHSDGSSETVNVTVPQVTMVGIYAGVVQTQYVNNTIDSSLAIVKEIYSDGSAKQVNSGYTVGGLSIDITNGGKEFRYASSSVSYKGYSASIRSYHGDGTWKKHPATNRNVVGTNKDILLIPGIYDGTTTNGEPVTEVNKPTTSVQQPTTSESPSATTAEQTTVADETQSASETETQFSQNSTEETLTETQSNADDNDKNIDKPKKSSKIWVIILCILLVAVIAVAGYMLVITKQRERNRRRRRRRR